MSDAASTADLDGMLALPAQTFAEWPGELAALALLPATGEQPRRLVERRFGPHLEEALVYEHHRDITDIVHGRGMLHPIRVHAAQSGSLGWIVWQEEGWLVASPRRLLDQVARLALPVDSVIATDAVETAGHDLVLHALLTSRGHTEVFSCRFGAPVEVEDPADPNDPDDWDDIDLALGPARCTRLGQFEGMPMGTGALAVSATAMHLVLPIRCPDAAADGIDGGPGLIHLRIEEQRLQSQGLARHAGLRLPDSCSAAVRVDENGAVLAALLAFKVSGQADSPDGPAWQPILWSVRFAAGDAGGEIDGSAEACGRPQPAMPRASAVAFSFIAGESLQARAAVVGRDGSLLLSDNSGRLQVLAQAPDARPLVPIAMLSCRDAAYVAVRSGAGPVLLTVRYD